MSIHKSKGLEYPICFVAGLGKSMNFMETRSRIVVHAGYGVAADGVDLENRAKIRGLAKKVFARKLLQDQMGEEVRVLYVAMTRAREKLILVGTVEDMAQTAEKWAISGKVGAAADLQRDAPGRRVIWTGWDRCSGPTGSREKAAGFPSGA